MYACVHIVEPGVSYVKRLAHVRGGTYLYANLTRSPGGAMIALVMEDLVIFLRSLTHTRGITPSQLGKEIGVSHATVSRWLSGKDVPSPKSCGRLADYGNVSPEWVLSLAQHLPLLQTTGASEWPEFREYARQKYPQELDDDLIVMIEDLIERRRKKREGGRPT
jgi:transcriptional regulator with XRE-family HTH domain